MLAAKARALINNTLRKTGFEIRRTTARATWLGALVQARQAGLAVGAIFDVGAATGGFTRQCLQVFPNARCVVIEPLAERRDALTRLVADQPETIYVQAVAAAEPGVMNLHVHADLDGSSLLSEMDVGGVNGVSRSVEATTLDRIAAEFTLPGPYLLKLDVQGAEQSVLAGASEVLRSTEYVLLEVSLFRFFEGGFILHEVIADMQSRGFVVYDVLHRQYRPLDQALAQLDLMFVREQGSLRRHQHYATSEQRRALGHKLAPRR